MKNVKPTMMTVGEVARSGILSEQALRILLEAGTLPAIYDDENNAIVYK